MKISSLAVALAVFAPMAVQAQVPDAQANRLGVDLTPIGAEKAGEGDIPAWTGGLQSPPASVNYKPGDHLKDPFASDPIKYTITSANVGQYSDVLADGYEAMMKAYPDYKMNVYETRRTCAYPDFVYQATKSNAKVGVLNGGGSGVGAAVMGFPFPVPNNANEIIWNHTLRYRSFKLHRQFAAAPVTRGGDYTLQIVQDHVILDWSNPAHEKAEDLNNTSIYYIANTIAPAREAGNVILVLEALNATINGGRQAWQYSPGTRRVRRAPNISYDNPGTNSDGLSTSDSFDGYNGALDRYDWRVIDKSPKIIAANTYKSSSAPYKDFLKPLHLNQDLIRYELHRTWNFEAKLKSNTRHVYARRVYHNDEDAWQIASAELYDGRGQLWRVQEIHQMNFYQVPLCHEGAEIVYDLQAGRYLALAMQNEETPVEMFAKDITPDDYTPNAIRQMGVR